MEERWRQLCTYVGVDGEDIIKLYNDIVSHYEEDGRDYHALGHIEHCLDEFDVILGLAHAPLAVGLAIWCHDVIYDVRAKDNEEKSAAFAVQLIKDMKLSNDLGQLVAKLIMATKHDSIPVDDDCQLIADIDLSILGQPAWRFDEYERQVRKEYKWLSDDEFAAGRLKFLTALTQRQAIYSTKYFRDKYEAQAWHNIARSLARLQGAK